jgi:drug/metabolite transporter (DMT)-like permease
MLAYIAAMFLAVFHGLATGVITAAGYVYTTAANLTAFVVAYPFVVIPFVLVGGAYAFGRNR